MASDIDVTFQSLDCMDGGFPYEGPYSGGGGQTLTRQSTFPLKSSEDLYSDLPLTSSSRRDSRQSSFPLSDIELRSGFPLQRCRSIGHFFGRQDSEVSVTLSHWDSCERRIVHGE